jgi:hypothetical protein
LIENHLNTLQLMKGSLIIKSVQYKKMKMEPFGLEQQMEFVVMMGTKSQIMF